MRCINCSTKFTVDSCGKGFVAKVLLKEEKGLNTFTFFTDAMLSLLNSLNIEQKEDHLNILKDKLPMKVAYTKNGDKLSTLRYCV